MRVGWSVSQVGWRSQVFPKLIPFLESEMTGWYDGKKGVGNPRGVEWNTF